MWDSIRCGRRNIISDKPNRWLTSGGAGTMGFGPLRRSAWFAAKDQEIWAVAGDGGFQMTAGQLTTAVQEGVNVKVAIMNNQYLRHGAPVAGVFLRQALLGGEHAHARFCQTGWRHGVPARLVSSLMEVQEAIEWARKTQGPVVLEFRVEQEGGLSDGATGRGVG
ncbi:MAG: thiamine pyrophosphate-dependent enzyme [Anaerolineales bacterium]